MTSEEIKTEIGKAYEQVKQAQDRLAELRSICNHEKTHRGLYSYRIGAVSEEEMCDYCDLPIAQDLPVRRESANEPAINPIIMKIPSPNP